MAAQSPETGKRDAALGKKLSNMSGAPSGPEGTARHAVPRTRAATICGSREVAPAPARAAGRPDGACTSPCHPSHRAAGNRPRSHQGSAGNGGRRAFAFLPGSGSAIGASECRRCGGSQRRAQQRSRHRHDRCHHTRHQESRPPYAPLRSPNGRPHRTKTALTQTSGSRGQKAPNTVQAIR